jgi:exonuclease SbcD
VHTVPLNAPHDMRLVEGFLDEVMALPYSEDYVWVTLRDELPPPDARVTVSTVFPNMMKFSILNSKTKTDEDILAKEQMENKTIEELFSDFYRLQNNDQPPTSQHMRILRTLLKKLEAEKR